jgi:hypothetical protein
VRDIYHVHAADDSIQPALAGDDFGFFKDGESQGLTEGKHQAGILYRMWATCV